MTPEQIRGNRARAHRTHAAKGAPMRASDRKVGLALLDRYHHCRGMEIVTGRSDIRARLDWAEKADRALVDLRALLSEGLRP